MLKNYLVTAFRNLMKYKFYSFIIILGLSIGIATSLITLLYVQDELSYDQFHKYHDRLYLCGVQMTIGDKTSTQITCNPGLAELLKQQLTGIEEYTRIQRKEITLIKQGNNTFYEKNLIWADPSFFTMFSYDFILGDPNTCLGDVNSIVLTESAARKYFGVDNPLNELLDVAEVGVLKVTGVIKDVPTNSFIQIDGVISIQSHFKTTPYTVSPSKLSGNMGYVTYFLFKEGYKLSDFHREYAAFHKEHLVGTGAERLKFKSVLDKVSDVHLNSKIMASRSSGALRTLYGVISIGLLVLLLACVNHVNLSTSNASRRSREIATRKIVGSSKKQLVLQLLGESLFYSLLAFFVGMFLAAIVLKFTPINEMLGKNFTIDIFGNSVILLYGFGLMFLTGILAGIYPAFYLTGISPVKGIKGDSEPGGKIAIFKNALVVFQFVIAIVALSLTFVMSKQVNYMLEKDLGFNSNNLIVLNTVDKNITERVKTFKNELLSVPGVESASLSNATPASSYDFTGYAFKWEMNDGKMETYAFPTLQADKDYFKTFDIEIIQGTNFLSEDVSDTTNLDILVNESLVKKFGWESPIGKRCSIGKVIGVVKDFNIYSLEFGMQPLIISQPLRKAPLLNIKIKDREKAATVGAITKRWKRFYPERPIDFVYLDESLRNQYLQNVHQKNVAVLFASVCIFISCLGLLGLASYTLKQRRKEIGIRKVFGGTIPDIMKMFIYLFSKWVILANIIAWPLAYFLMNEWLETFANKTDVGIGTFVLSGLVTLTLAVLAVSWQTYKASVAKPVDSIKYE